MKIVTLIENTTCREDLTPEHGLSLYIEANGKKILFDAGETGAFADNAEKLGIDLGQIDLAILSHGHCDHSGGLLRFMKLNATAPIWLRPEARGSYHNASGNCISLDPELKKSPRLRLAEEGTQLGEGLTLFSCNHREKQVPLNAAGLTVCKNGICEPDNFLHEQYLLIEEEGKRVLISGCSHKGIRNIVHWFAPDVLIGGFHFMRVDPADPELSAAAQALLSYDTVYYTGHCTGENQYAVMKKIMADKLQSLSTGKEIYL